MNKLLNKALGYLSEFNDKNIGVLAAGVAFFTSLAFFPALAAAVAGATFIITPAQLGEVIGRLYSYLPADIAAMLSAQLQMETGHHASNLVIAIIGIVLSIFSASGAANNMIKALNAAYGVKETRNFIKVRLLSMALTLGAITSGLISMVLLIIKADILADWGAPEVVLVLLPYVRWVVLAAIVCLSLEILYRYGVNRKKRSEFRFLTVGTGVATALCMVVTLVFFLYTQYLAGFSRSYSVFAGVVVLMIWLNLSSLAVLVGALINAHRGR